MTLVDHECRRKPRDVGRTSNQLAEDQEQLERLYAPPLKIIISILAVIKVKPAQFSALDQPRDDKLDIHIGGMMAEVDQAQRLRPKLGRRKVCRPPIIDDSRVE